MNRQHIADELELNGFTVVRDCFPSATVAMLLEQISRVKPYTAARSRGGQPYAVRNLLTVVPQIKSLAFSEPLQGLARNLLGLQARPVKGTLFDKHETANWKVPWHQDQIITVQNYAEAPGFGPWSTKHGFYTVQPPVEVLEHMIAVRIHLDDCSVINGALKVIPGSHLQGKLSAEQISQYRKQAAVMCEARMGDVLIMRPLLLHQSSAGSRPNHRRVIHLEYAATDLPGDLKWPE
ncbi:MAG: phytanoyl-CoA dioxygenase family protein [Cyanobacteria bacterium P01_A01_bin.17]